MDMEEVQRSVLEDLAQLDDPLSQMEYLLACAKARPGIPVSQRLDKNLVPSCQARTWVIVSWEKGLLHMQADSESFLVKGALALLCEVYDGRSREEIQAFTCRMLDDPGFVGRLTGEQQRGLASILEELHRQAVRGGGETTP